MHPYRSLISTLPCVIMVHSFVLIYVAGIVWGVSGKALFLGPPFSEFSGE